MEQFWWTMAGPASAVADAAAALRRTKHVILQLPDQLSWPDTMRDRIRKIIEDEAGSASQIRFDDLRLPDENPENLPPGEFLLTRYDRSFQYRAGSGETVQDYLVRKNILRGHVVWIQEAEPEVLQSWISFCENLRPADVAGGLFVFETRGQGHLRFKANRVHVTDFSRFITPYDVMVFAGMLAGDAQKHNPYSGPWREYAAALAAKLCGTDAELAAAVIESTDFRKLRLPDDVRTLLKECGAQRPDGWNDGGAERAALPDESEIVRRIWEAQVQVLFPRIEIARANIVEKYRAELQRILDENTITYFDGRITDAEGLETGPLTHILSMRDSGTMRYLLEIPEKEREQISFLRECRNALAHQKLCSSEQTDRLLM